MRWATRILKGERLIDDTKGINYNKNTVFFAEGANDKDKQSLVHNLHTRAGMK